MLARLIVCLLLTSAMGAQGQAVNWHLVQGDPGNAAVDTVLVDPVPAERDGAMRTLYVRVSRATPRTSWDGVPHRSYDSTVLFDCGRNTARYLVIAPPSSGGTLMADRVHRNEYHRPIRVRIGAFAAAVL